jgi:signal transduction histidine kinase
VDQIVNLTNDLLFLQEQELVLRDFLPVNLQDVVEKVVAKYEGKAKLRGVTIKVRKNANLPTIQGDESSLERAISGLVDNAIKFSHPGGTVDIRFADLGNHASVSVVDYGIGIDPQIRPRIFDRFFHLEKSSDEIYDGLGIGLSITRQVIRQHRGILDVDSEPGKGSTFTISLLKRN